ncbi:DNA damage-inducible protein 1-like [Spinacia oleracea]|uniref:DNA damage-inducible protein 1-like n=1 Tax=Spinacia oleracea TaxID=3562 RepID=A0ABM3QX06_SPIOL|nr:DNA damage-inducible protein 1-like [Spinacia oleracea]
MGEEVHRNPGHHLPYQQRSKISTPSGNISRLNCLLCRDPHKWWECKHKGEIDNLQRKLSAMSVEETPKETEEEACNEDDEPRRMSSVYMMYVMGKEAPETREESTNMMYVDLVINGRNARAMVDTGASHNFVTEAEARRLGSVLKKGGGSMKFVNSKAKPILGVAEQVEAKLGDYEGKMNFTAVKMDDFNLVLGLEFLRSSKAVIMPHLNSLLVAGGQTCLVRSTGTPTKTKEKGRLLLAMRVMEPLRKATSQIH